MEHYHVNRIWWLAVAVWTVCDGVKSGWGRVCFISQACRSGQYMLYCTRLSDHFSMANQNLTHIQYCHKVKEIHNDVRQYWVCNGFLLGMVAVVQSKVQYSSCTLLDSMNWEIGGWLRSKIALIWMSSSYSTVSVEEREIYNQIRLTRTGHNVMGKLI